MTAADRPSVTDNARAEAWRRFPDGIDPETGEPVDDYGYPATAREAFIGGAEWAAGRAETTTATVEDTARAIHRALAPRWMSVAQALGLDQDAYEAMLADIAQAIADAGLLATARTRPTREQIITALDHEGAFCGVCGREPGDPLDDCDDCRRCLHRYADAVLALYADQPTETTTDIAEDALDSLPYFTFEDDDVAPDEEFVRKADVARLLATTRTRPTREQIDRAVGEVLSNASNHPDPVAVLGRSIAPLRTKITDAVLELLRDGAR